MSWLYPLNGFEIIFLLCDSDIVSKTKPFLSLSRVSLLRSISWCSLLYLYQTNLTTIILSHLILILFSEEFPDVHSCGRTTDFFLRKYNLEQEGIDKNVSRVLLSTLVLKSSYRPNGRLGFYESVKK